MTISPLAIIFLTASTAWMGAGVHNYLGDDAIWAAPALGAAIAGLGNALAAYQRDRAQHR